MSSNCNLIWKNMKWRYCQPDHRPKCPANCTTLLLNHLICLSVISLTSGSRLRRNCFARIVTCKSVLLHVYKHHE
jgi:hypothetical protein